MAFLLRMAQELHIDSPDEVWRMLLLKPYMYGFSVAPPIFSCVAFCCAWAALSWQSTFLDF